jgi:hypothetical protein
VYAPTVFGDPQLSRESDYGTLPSAGARLQIDFDDDHTIEMNERDADKDFDEDFHSLYVGYHALKDLVNDYSLDGHQAYLDHYISSTLHK